MHVYILNIYISTLLLSISQSKEVKYLDGFNFCKLTWIYMCVNSSINNEQKVTVWKDPGNIVASFQ